MCLFLITLGEPVSYPVNQVEGFELTIEKPTWSPFKGYTIRWAVTANSKEIYRQLFLDGCYRLEINIPGENGILSKKNILFKTGTS